MRRRASRHACMRSHLPLAGALLAGLALAGPAQASPPAGVDVDVRDRTLIVRGTPGDDAIGLRRAGAKLEVDAGRDGSAEFRIDRRRFRDVLILGGDGADVVDGGPDDDLVFLGAGDDRFVWEPGDGADLVDGEEGDDEQLAAGTAAGERIEIAARHRRILLSVDRDTQRSANVERIALAPGGGADTVVAGDVTGTAVNDVDADLGADGRADRVVVEGGDVSDFGSVFGGGGFGTFVGGMSTLVQLHGEEPADALTVRGRAGADNLSAGGYPSGGMQLTLDGGDGDDVLAGGNGPDTVLGGDGIDSAEPAGGDDVARLGADLDILRWDAGDGADTFDGQQGHDVLFVVGSAAPEAFAATADGTGARFSAGADDLTLRGVERLDVLAQGGADTFAVGDLAGTPVVQAEVNLGGSPGGPASDGQPDRVSVAGTRGDDAIAVAGSGTTADVTGLPATVRVTRADAATDTLAIDGGDGADALDAAGLAPGVIGLAFTD
jgi:hypothetical protein